MCTVSVIPIPGGRGLRLAFNRDELLSRPRGRPPVVRRFGDRLALMPIDPSSKGTWIAVNDAGVLLAILNVNDGRHVRPGRRSRGLIIPSLLHAEDATWAVQAAGELEVHEFAPFRAIVMDAEHCVEVRSDGEHLSLDEHDGTAPLMFTSSGLGDALVEGPRRIVFDAILRCETDPIRGQDRFHAYRDYGSPHLGVWMRRGDAATVSRTVIELGEEEASMSYVDLADEAEVSSRVVHSAVLGLEPVGVT